MLNQDSKGGVRIYRDAGEGNFQEVVTAPDLHLRDIMSIQTQTVGDNMLLITAGKDGKMNLNS